METTKGTKGVAGGAVKGHTKSNRPEVSKVQR